MTKKDRSAAAVLARELLDEYGAAIEAGLGDVAGCAELLEAGSDGGETEDALFQLLVKVDDLQAGLFRLRGIIARPAQRPRTRRR